MLQLMPPGDNMDMGKGYDDNDWLRRSSLSQRLMKKVLQSNLVLIFSSCIVPHGCFIVPLPSNIYSVDIFLYPYTLPILQFPYPFSSLCLSAT